MEHVHQKRMISNFWLNRCCTWFLNIVVIATTIVSCTPTGQGINQARNTDANSRSEQLSETTYRFAHAITMRDIDTIQQVMEEPAYEKLNQWLSTNPPLHCEFVTSKFKLSASGGSSVSDVENSDLATKDIIRVFVPCKGRTSGSYRGFYNLEIHNARFEYLEDSWIIQKWESIKQYKSAS